jgi:hypothetical protein
LTKALDIKPADGFKISVLFGVVTEPSRAFLRDEADTHNSKQNSRTDLSINNHNHNHDNDESNRDNRSRTPSHEASDVSISKEHHCKQPRSAI